MLISDLKGDSAASAYRGAIFEADAIHHLSCGGTFQLQKCTTAQDTPEVVSLSLLNTRERYLMPDLESLNVLDALNRIIVPDARNFESVVAFCVSTTPFFTSDSGGTRTDSPCYPVLGFQMTVGKSHPTKLKGVTQVVEKVKSSLPTDSNVTFAAVFVVPDDVQTSYLVPQSILKNDGTVLVQRDPVFSDRNQYRLVINYSK